MIISRQISPAFQLFDEISRNLTGFEATTTLKQLARKHQENSSKRSQCVTRTTILTPLSAASSTQYNHGYSNLEPTGEVEIFALLASTSSGLQGLFESGAAHPTDVDEFGNTLLDVSTPALLVYFQT